MTDPTKATTGPLTITGIGVVGGWHVPTVWFLGTARGVVALPGNADHDALLESWREAFRSSDVPVSARIALDAHGNPIVGAA